jgi:hypothetical protein
MGCSTCGKRSIAQPQESRPRSNFVSQFQNVTPPEDCNYTLVQIKEWSNLLTCAKNKGLYIQLGVSAQKMNRYLGRVLSALHYPTNPCYFEKDLNEVVDLIIAIQNLNQC